ncbi:hypothetical protein EYF80_028719 [Liparis tanakae]|uniref:Uncharacterized protein n=1 Tax=Liparis tanakae TaxID=230148 RepID=A0A4Z2H5Q5_9TELE|nr:hypothetical protein EYF80_028719 [Liparis tanakae]
MWVSSAYEKGFTVGADLLLGVVWCSCGTEYAELPGNCSQNHTTNEGPRHRIHTVLDMDLFYPRYSPLADPEEASPGGQSPAGALDKGRLVVRTWSPLRSSYKSTGSAERTSQSNSIFFDLMITLFFRLQVLNQFYPQPMVRLGFPSGVRLGGVGGADCWLQELLPPLEAVEPGDPESLLFSRLLGQEATGGFWSWSVRMGEEEEEQGRDPCNTAEGIPRFSLGGTGGNDRPASDRDELRLGLLLSA